MAKRAPEMLARFLLAGGLITYITAIEYDFQKTRRKEQEAQQYLDNKISFIDTNKDGVITGAEFAKAAGYERLTAVPAYFKVKEGVPGIKVEEQYYRQQGKDLDGLLNLHTTEYKILTGYSISMSPETARQFADSLEKF